MDIIRALLQQPDFQAARKYWNKLKERLGKERSEPVTNCHRLKLIAEDGKMRLTDSLLHNYGTGGEGGNLSLSRPTTCVVFLRFYLTSVTFEKIAQPCQLLMRKSSPEFWPDRKPSAQFGSRDEVTAMCFFNNPDSTPVFDTFSAAALS